MEAQSVSLTVAQQINAGGMFSGRQDWSSGMGPAFRDHLQGSDTSRLPSPCRERHQRSQKEAEEDLRRELGIFFFLLFLFLLFQYGVYNINKSDLTCGKAFQILGGLLPTYLSASGCCSLLSWNCHHHPPPDKHY